MLETITNESIERLYVLNSLRDALFANSQKLKDMKVFSVLGFGSTIRGEANESSDIDICVLVQKPEWQSWADYKARETLLKTLFDNDQFPPITHLQYGVEKAGREVHIILSEVSNRTVLPHFIQDSIVLWSDEAT